MERDVKASDLRLGDKAIIYGEIYYFRDGEYGRTLYHHPTEGSRRWCNEEHLGGEESTLKKFTLIERGEKMKKDIYKEGVWYPWTGGECPLHENDYVQYILVDSHEGSELFEKRVGSTTSCTWQHDYSYKPLVAFKITKKYQPAKEMTVAEISKELGYDVKIVK